MLDSACLQLIRHTPRWCRSASPELWSAIEAFTIEHSVHIVVHCFNREFAQVPRFAQELPEHQELLRHYCAFNEHLEEQERASEFGNAVDHHRQQLQRLTAGYAQVSEQLRQLVADQPVMDSNQSNARFNRDQVVQSLMIQIAELWFFYLTDDQTAAAQRRRLRSYCLDISEWARSHQNRSLARLFLRHLLNPLGIHSVPATVPLLCDGLL